MWWLLAILGLLLLIVAYVLYRIQSKLSDKQQKTKRDHVWIAIIGVALMVIGIVLSLVLQKGIESFAPDKIPTSSSDEKVQDAVKLLTDEGAVILEDSTAEESKDYTFVDGMAEVMIRNKSQEKIWSDNITADLDDILQLKITFRNKSEMKANDVVVISKFLNDNFYIIPGTLTLYNSNYKDGLVLSTSDISGGINIGNYIKDASAVVTFDFQIVDNSLGVGLNVLRPWIQIYDDGSKLWSQDNSDIFVYKTENGVSEVTFIDGKIEFEK